ncbi:hypothetical protein O3P69_014841 [Scylla paramamosain]|uniref:CCHC-type domain-containing protein n=1 Tax=Scylla paramamosain TaxID=85552 RepID=A0AAW0U036_SCYPA
MRRLVLVFCAMVLVAAVHDAVGDSEFRGKCYSCGQQGHTKRYCPQGSSSGKAVNGRAGQYQIYSQPYKAIKGAGSVSRWCGGNKPRRRSADAPPAGRSPIATLHHVRRRAAASQCLSVSHWPVPQMWGMTQHTDGAPETRFARSLNIVYHGKPSNSANTGAVRNKGTNRPRIIKGRPNPAYYTI